MTHVTQKPVFENVFGADWHHLPPVMKKHYANRAYTNESFVAQGHLEIVASPLGKMLFPLFRLFGILVPRTGKNVVTTVTFSTTSDSDAFRFERSMVFEDGDTYRFCSKMKPLGGNDMIEIMRCQLGWRMAYTWDGSKVALRHRGYAFNCFGLLIPLPITFLLGQGYAEEVPIDADRFSMMTEIRHPWWGRIYSYRGTFRMTGAA